MKKLYQMHKQGFQLLRFIYRLDHSALPIFLLRHTMEAVSPYLQILFSAIIIDALLQQHWEKAGYTILIMLIVNLLFGLLLDYVKSKSQVRSMSVHRQFNAMICLKTIDLDYATFADKEGLEAFSQADAAMAIHGGFGLLLEIYTEMVQHLLSVSIAIVLLLELCQKYGQRMPGVLGFFLTPVGSLCTLCVLFISLLLLYGKSAEYVNKNNLQIFEHDMSVHQEMQYFDSYAFHADKGKDVRIYRMQPMLLQAWNALCERLNQSLRKEWQYTRRSTLFYVFINHIVMLLSYIFATLKFFSHAISIGEFTKYSSAIAKLNEALRSLVENNGQLRTMIGYLSYYSEYMKKENKLDTGTLPVEKRLDNEFEIAFHNVSFAYPNTNTYVLKNVSLTLNLKQKIALVGPNGAGKSTFIKLLCRLYDVSEGSITLNGIDIRKYDYQEYLNLFAAVFQDFTLFEFPVGENVACEQQYDETRVWQVLQQAGVRKRVERMKVGLATPMFYREKDGEDVSGGEAQKIAIARALYKDAPFVILDEPTSALDPISEYEIYTHFHDMVKNKTSIYISHRMSSCRFCDDILVFDHGQLLQRGTHEELMKDTKQVYAKMWKAQAKYYV